MIKYITPLLASCFVIISCSQHEELTDTNNASAERNKEAWHAVSMAFATGDLSKIDSVVAPDYLDHRSYGDVKGRDSLKAHFVKGQLKFTNIKMETIKELVDKDYGFFWMRFTGRKRDTTSGSGAPIEFKGIQVVRFENGKAAEHWEFIEPSEMMKMMK